MWYKSSDFCLLRDKLIKFALKYLKIITLRLILYNNIQALNVNNGFDRSNKMYENE